MDTHFRDKLLQTYAQGERKFTYWPLNGADLHDADLQDGNFYGSDLSGANLSGANLMRANLGNANLRNANLSNTFLAGANLSGADVDGTDFSGANYTSPPPIVTAQPIVTAVGDPISHYCIQCGAQLPAGTQFCPRCGHAQVSASPAAPSYSAPAPATVPFVSALPSTSPAPVYKTVVPSSAQPIRATTSSQRTSGSKAVNSLVVTAFVASEVWGFIYKAAVVILVIVGIVFFLKSCAANATLNEHSSCGQFEQADTDTQNRVLQDMMTAHHDTQDNVTLARFSVTLYCNVNGPNAPIDGIYSSGDHSTQQPAQALRQRGARVAQMNTRT